MGGVDRAAALDATRTPSALLTRRGARCWPPTSSRSIACELDGYVYPAIQMPPPDETMPQDGALSHGPHSDTSWVNMIGVPAVVVPAGSTRAACRSGSSSRARPWTTATCSRSPRPWSRRRRAARRRILVERGLLAVTPAREARTAR
jgi:hypothetical protein